MISFDVLFERMDRVLEAVPEAELDRWVVFDFDGVCSSFKEGWQGKDVFGLPVKGTAELVRKIQEMGVKVALVTTRPATPALEEWLEENGYNFDSVNDTSHNPPDSGKVKPIAELYVDDRGYRFDEYDVEKSAREIMDLMAKASHVTKPALAPGEEAEE